MIDFYATELDYLGPVSDDPVSLEISAALGRFESRLSKGDLPNLSDLHAFLNIIAQYPVDLRCNLTAQEITRDTIKICEVAYQYMDVALCFILSQLKERLSPVEIMCILNDPASTKSLVAKAVERTLKNSLAILLACGATLGHGETPRTVFAALNDAKVFFTSAMKERVAYYQVRFRSLLDLSAVFTVTGNDVMLYNALHATEYDGITGIHSYQIKSILVKSLSRTLRSLQV